MSITLYSDSPDTASIKVGGNDRISIGVGGEVSYTNVLVSQLPTSVGIGSKLFVTDSSTTTFNSVVVGGGTNKIPVFFDGTSWRVG